MNKRRLTPMLALLVGAGTCVSARITSAADAPTAAQALTLTPIQKFVEYAIPAKEEIAQCTIRPEKENGVTSWVVRNRQGEVLRKFADSNNDNVVDQWCYFQNGIEVYRDIDSNFNGKADEYRWFNAAGTRWGIDKNEDGEVDTWKVISPHEVAEQVVLALKSRDPARFELLLLSSNELNDLGLGKARQESISQSVKDAPAAFSKVVSEQKIVTPKTRYVDFGSARPGAIPAGTDGSTKDVIICDNGTALIQTDDKHEQVFIGTLVSVGNTWKLIDAPTVGSENQRTDTGLFTQQQSPSGAAGDGSPSEEMLSQLSNLEKLEKEADSLSADQLAANIEKRISTLQNVVKLAPAKERDQWQRQLIDVLYVAIQSDSFPKGGAVLASLQQQLENDKADDDLIAHAAFQSMSAQFAVDQRDPKADMGKVQEKYLADLSAFVGKYPKSVDAAEALLQLGIYQEATGKTDEAVKWYQQLVSNSPNTHQQARAAGALARLSAIGKPIKLSGKDLLTGNAVDLDRYRGKAVLIHYWTTISDTCKNDMVVLKDVYAKRGGRDFDIISVCLDNDPTAAKQFLTQNKFPWRNIYEPGGLDGRLATEMGVLTLPLMLLVDQKGIVVNQNIHTAELETQLDKLPPPAPAAAGTANQPRPGASGGNAAQPRQGAAPGTANSLRAQPTSR